MDSRMQTGTWAAAGILEHSSQEFILVIGYDYRSAIRENRPKDRFLGPEIDFL